MAWLVGVAGGAVGAVASIAGAGLLKRLGAAARCGCMPAPGPPRCWH
ncbi:hypothetical protein WJ972_03620 [Achromobacter insuavis]